MDEITKDEKIVYFSKNEDPEYKNSYGQNIEKMDKDNDNLYNAPNVVGKNITEAKSLLSKYDIYIYYQFSDRYANGIVINQKVEGNRIVLYVSKGKQT